MLTEGEFNKNLVAQQPDLLRYAISLTKDQPRAEDLVQNVMLRAISNRHSFEEGTNFGAWLFTICKNEFFSDARKSYNRTRQDDPDGAILENAASEGAAADDTVTDEYSQVSRVIATLPEVQRQVIAAVAEGIPYTDIAEKFSISEGTVKSRLHRARTTLIEFSGTTHSTNRKRNTIGGKDRFRRIDTLGFRNPPKFEGDVGEVPALVWIKITELFVDESYQRLIGEHGLSAVYRIAKEFDWKKFGALVVARVGDKFALIDGQHRAYAAALRRLLEVPCTVVQATTEEQAAAFAAINAKVVRVNDLSIHRAAVAAKDPAALRLNAVCERAEVTICRYKSPENALKPGETLALGTIRSCLKRYGEEALVLALQLIQHKHRHQTSMLRAPLIHAMVWVVNELNNKVRPAALLSRVEDINLQTELLEAKIRGAEKGVSAWFELRVALLAYFQDNAPKETGNTEKVRMHASP